MSKNQLSVASGYTKLTEERGHCSSEIVDADAPYAGGGAQGIECPYKEGYSQRRLIE